jgi:putative transposase/transposase-like zinc-binding protein
MPTLLKPVTDTWPDTDNRRADNRRADNRRADSAGSGKRPALEVADIFRAYGAAYRRTHQLPSHLLKAMHAIEVCRTAALGGHLEQCTACGYQRPVYNSCRNRHCPKCQALAKAKWLADRQSELLPVGYFHNVFTLPHELNALVAANQASLYSLLFKAAAQTLLAFAADSQHGLGGQLGFLAVLHTWDQKLLYHVHLHCVIAGGALSFDKSRWLPAKPKYLFSVRALSQAFRDRYLKGLRRLWADGQLCLPKRLASLTAAEAFEQFLAPLAAKDWVVYCQPPFAGPDKVLAYLSRYTHRVAISNQRLKSFQDGRVTFDYRDRRDGNRVKQLTLPAFEFLRRFLWHVVPTAFCRIRYFGFLGNRVRQACLARCRLLLGQVASPVAEPASGNALDFLAQLTGVDVRQCPRCQVGTLVVVERLPAPSAQAAGPGQPTAGPDSS